MAEVHPTSVIRSSRELFKCDCKIPSRYHNMLSLKDVHNITLIRKSGILFKDTLAF